MKHSLIYTIAITALSLASLCACSESHDENPEQNSTKAERNFIVEGNEQYAQANYTDAEAAYRKALSANPNSVMAQFNLASALLRQDPKMGKNAPTPAQPQQADSSKSSTEQASKQLQDAVAILKALVEGSSDPAVVSAAAYDLGNISYKQQDYGQAIECYKEVLRKNPKYDEARYNLRMAQLKQKDKNKNNNKDKKNNNKDDNKDKKKDKDKNKDKQDSDKGKDKNQQSDREQENSPNARQKSQQQGGMSQQNMEQILRTMQNQENATQQRVNAARAKQQQGERDRTRNKW